MQLTYVVRAYPTVKQHALFADYLQHTRQLYNAALAERIDCYRKTGQTVSNGQQARELTELRLDEDYSKYPRRMQRWAIDLVERAYKGMFTRHRKGDKLGVPRFRGALFWNTIGWDSPIGLKMRSRGLHSKKSFGGTLRLMPDRVLPDFDSCTALRLCKDGDRWFAHLTYLHADVAPKLAPQRPVGLDVGLKSLAARSDGVLLDVPRQSTDDTADQRRCARALSRCKKRSKRRIRVRARLRKANQRIAAKRKARLHVVSARLIHHFDAIAVEDLNLHGISRGGGAGAAGRGIRKSWRDRAPGTLVEMLAWKATRHGRQFKAVDPRGTSILCSSCGTRVEKTLRDRVHRCECGCILDRDVNAARNVLARAGWGPGAANLGGRVTTSVVPGAGLAIKHGGRKAAGPRRVRADAQPPPSLTRRERIRIGELPARAGMDRTRLLKRSHTDSVPRACGDGPTWP